MIQLSLKYYESINFGEDIQLTKLWKDDIQFSTLGVEDVYIVTIVIERHSNGFFLCFTNSQSWKWNYFIPASILGSINRKIILFWQIKKKAYWYNSCHNVVKIDLFAFELDFYLSKIKKWLSWKCCLFYRVNKQKC